MSSVPSDSIPSPTRNERVARALRASRFRGLAVMFATMLFGASTTIAQSPPQFQWAETCATTMNCINNLLLPTPASISSWSPRTTMLADLDMDNDIDLLSAGPGLQLTRNETVLGAAPGFNAYTDASSQIQFGVILSGIVDGVLADFDGDGDLDLAVAVSTMVSGTINNGNVWILQNNARPIVPNPPSLLTDAQSASWTNPPTVNEALTSIAAGDFDGDGDPDLVVGGPNGVVMFENVPGGVAGARAFINAPATRIPAALRGINVLDIAAADLDTDGDVDFAIAGGTVVGGVVTAAIRTVGLNPGPTGSFTATSLPAPFPAVVSLSTTVEAADLNGDGLKDLAFGHRATKPSFSAPWAGGELVLFTNGPTPGAFAVSQVFTTPQSATDIAVGDIDEDGLADIVMSCHTEDVSIQNMGVWTTFSLPGRTLLFSRPAAGSPFADVTLGRIDDDTVIVVPNPPNPPTTFPTNGESVALADLDLDLDLDLVVGHAFAKRAGVFVNQLWQIETRRDLPSVDATDPPNGMFQWKVRWDMYREVGLPQGIGGANVFLGASFDAPVHQFPVMPFGIATVASYSIVSGIVIQGGYGHYTMVLGDFDAATRNALVGLQVFATCAILDIAPPYKTRLTGVVQTTLQQQ